MRICAAAYSVSVIIDWVRTRNIKCLLLEFFVLLGLVALDILIASASTGYVTFGAGNSPIVMVFIMFAAILLGIGARYIFYVRVKFSWLDFAKPLCISPILLFLSSAHWKG